MSSFSSFVSGLTSAAGSVAATAIRERGNTERQKAALAVEFNPARERRKFFSEAMRARRDHYFSERAKKKEHKRKKDLIAFQRGYW